MYLRADLHEREDSCFEVGDCPEEEELSIQGEGLEERLGEGLGSEMGSIFE